jgi:iron complex outermembrane recepter protein
MSLCNKTAFREVLLVALGIGSAMIPGLAVAVDEIIVTAQRREESLQTIPISISAFSADSLSELGIEDSEQLTGLTPGLIIQRDVIGKVVIRGIGAENFTIGGDPGVAINFDGAYISRSSVSIFDMFDLERVEVLRGPQGTLYGRNATGGAINFLSKKPTEEIDGSAALDVGGYGKFRAEGAVGGPINDKAMFRVAAMSHQRDGFTKNIFPGVGRGLEELDNKSLWAGRALLTLKPSDSVTVELKADVYRDSSNPPPYKYTQDPVVYFGARNAGSDPFGAACGPDDPPACVPDPDPVFLDPTDDVASAGSEFSNPTAGDFFTVSQGFESVVPNTNRTFGDPGRWDQTGFMATVSWDLPNGMTFRSITSHRDMEFDWLNDGDGLEAFLVTYFQNDDTELLTQEFQLVSASDGPLTWVAGLYYLDESSDSFIGIPIAGFSNILIDGSSETNAYAVFAQADYALTDALTLHAGARYSYEDKEVSYLYDRFSDVFGSTFLTQVDDQDDWSSVTPKIGLDYQINDDAMVYGSITKGFKSGGFNLLAVQSSYNEEEVISYELGAKTQLADGRIRLNGSAFYMAYDDLQVGRVVNLSATIENAAKANMYGAEIEFVADMTDNFNVSAGLSWLETEYDEFNTGDPGYRLGDNPVDPSDDPAPPSCGTLLPIPTPGDIVPGDTAYREANGYPDQQISLAGCELPRAPNFSGFVGARYSFPLGGSGALDVSGNLQFTGDQFFTQFNRSDVAQDSYSIYNARVTWRSNDSTVRISLYGENLGDEEYFTNSLESGVPTAGVDGYVPQYFVGAPRTWGLKADYRFGGE